MKEEFLHYVWKHKLFHQENLKDDEGNQILVINPGQYNRDSGPDFFNALIRIGDTLWAGNVEIHVRSSHFNLHGHQSDPAYDNVILHVVAEYDKDVFNSRGEKIQTLKLDFNSSIYDHYLSMVNNPATVACENELNGAGPLLLTGWLSSLSVERLSLKYGHVKKILADTGDDWEETFYRMVARYFGFRVNAEPFEMLARTVPYRIVRKHADNLMAVEALLFGGAGMLDEGLFREAVDDDFYKLLCREYKNLSAKYSLRPIHGKAWKFARLRPANFPTLRIAQLAAMLTSGPGFFSRTIEAKSLNELKVIFEVAASSYWDTHYVFGKEVKKVKKSAGDQASDILIINSVVPVMFSYGKERSIDYLCERALTLLEELKPEKNKVSEEWKRAGVEADSALSSQALIHLREHYCTRRRCLECRIGAKLISDGTLLKKNGELMLEP